MSELYVIQGKTIFPVIDNSSPNGGWLPPKEDWIVTRWISIEIPEEATAKDRLFNLGDTNGCKLIDHTKEEYEAQ